MANDKTLASAILETLGISVDVAMGCEASASLGVVKVPNTWKARLAGIRRWNASSVVLLEWANNTTMPTIVLDAKAYGAHTSYRGQALREGERVWYVTTLLREGEALGVAKGYLRYAKGRNALVAGYRLGRSLADSRRTPTIATIPDIVLDWNVDDCNVRAKAQGRVEIGSTEHEHDSDICEDSQGAHCFLAIKR